MDCVRKNVKILVRKIIYIHLRNHKKYDMCTVVQLKINILFSFAAASGIINSEIVSMSVRNKILTLLLLVNSLSCIGTTAFKNLKDSFLTCINIIETLRCRFWRAYFRFFWFMYSNVVSLCLYIFYAFILLFLLFSFEFKVKKLGTSCVRGWR